MGLDQYLTKKTHVQNWDRHITTISKAASIKPERISYITEQIAYWRKANQIHKWFVDHVQDGTDDCGEYYVTRDQLQLLLTTCQLVLDGSKTREGKVCVGSQITSTGWEKMYEDGKIIVDSTLAEQLLPTMSGCFFGATDYDESYLKDLEYTKKVLEQALTEDPTGDYYYTSSW